MRCTGRPCYDQRLSSLRGRPCMPRLWALRIHMADSCTLTAAYRQTCSSSSASWMGCRPVVHLESHRAACAAVIWRRATLRFRRCSICTADSAAGRSLQCWLPAVSYDDQVRTSALRTICRDMSMVFRCLRARCCTSSPRNEREAAEDCCTHHDVPSAHCHGAARRQDSSGLPTAQVSLGSAIPEIRLPSLCQQSEAGNELDKHCSSALLAGSREYIA